MVYYMILLCITSKVKKYAEYYDYYLTKPNFTEEQYVYIMLNRFNTLKKYNE